MITMSSPTADWLDVVETIGSDDPTAGQIGMTALLAENLLGQTALADHGVQRSRLNVIAEVVIRDYDDLHFPVHDTTIPPMARRALIVEGEAVGLNDPDELSETEA